MSKLIDIGAIAADYSMVSILDSPQSQNYSSRAGAAALCVADESNDAFRRFHTALYSANIQPDERGPSFPDNAKLIELAREAGVVGKVPDCINSGKYLSKVTGESEKEHINTTPTIKINGENYEPSTPGCAGRQDQKHCGRCAGHRGRRRSAGRIVTTPVSAETADLTPESRPGADVPAPSAWWVLIAGVIGLAASMTLTVEKIDLLRNPSYVPSCNINPIVSCGSVMVTPQASVLGFPNSLLGLVGFTVVIVTGVLVVAKVSLPQWYWIGLTVGILIGAAFVHWLIFQSLYRIGALCPYCMVVWVVTVSLLVVVASIAFRPSLHPRQTGAAWALYQWRWSIAALWFTGVFLLIMVRFWNYWSTVL